MVCLQTVRVNNHFTIKLFCSMHESSVLSFFKVEYAFLCSALWTKAWRLYDLVVAHFCVICSCTQWHAVNWHCVCYILSMVNLLIFTCIWRSECESLVKGFPKARYKKFSTESEAWEFVHGIDASMYFQWFSEGLTVISAMEVILCQSSALPSVLAFLEHEIVNSAQLNNTLRT